MKFKTLLAAVLSVTAAMAQDATGTWQGTLQTPQRALRIVMKVTRASDETLKATLFSIDQPGAGINASAVTLQGQVLKMTIPAISGSYEGRLAADGNTVNGTFTQGGPLPLVLTKATPSTAWAIPDAPPPPKTMPPDAKPVFDVATIKPSDPEAKGQRINVGVGGANTFTTANTPLSELIKFAYGIHVKQLTGGPSWVDSEKFDITAKPDTPGMPSVTQLQMMVKQLLGERFGLVFHREKKELAAYVITVDKSGVKMSKAEGRGILPGFGGRGPGSIGVRNSTMAEFADFLQGRILDRPVVDQTGLTDRFDFTLEWLPDSIQAAAMAGGGPPPELPKSIEDRPDLIAAVRQQLGLKLESGKAQVETFVIDKVTKPTDN
ncbi:MAG: TIGR03435 family protein [Candidatus Solibacter sp.]